MRRKYETFGRVGETVKGLGGSGVSARRQVLSTFLHHTGTEQSNFAVILATNQKSVLDKAVLDRVDSWSALGALALTGTIQM